VAQPNRSQVWTVAACFALLATVSFQFGSTGENLEGRWSATRHPLFIV